MIEKNKQNRTLTLTTGTFLESWRLLIKTCQVADPDKGRAHNEQCLDWTQLGINDCIKCMPCNRTLYHCFIFIIMKHLSDPKCLNYLSIGFPCPILWSISVPNNLLLSVSICCMCVCILEYLYIGTGSEHQHLNIPWNLYPHTSIHK